MSGFEQPGKDADAWLNDESDASVEAEAEAEVIDSDDDEEDNEEGAASSTSATDSDAKKLVKEIPLKPLSKKEKAALKKKELDEMDDVFAEFGIDVDATVATTAPTSSEPVQEKTNAGDASDKKKKKKKPKKKTEAAADAAPVVPLTKEQIKAKLAAKAAAASNSNKGGKVPDSVAAALKEKSDAEKKMSKSERKRAQALDWER